MKIRKVLGYILVPIFVFCLVYGFKGNMIAAIARTITTIEQTQIITAYTADDGKVLVTRIYLSILNTESIAANALHYTVTQDGTNPPEALVYGNNTLTGITTSYELPDEITPQTTPMAPPAPAEPAKKPANIVEFTKPNFASGSSLSKIESIKIERQGEKCIAAFQEAAGSKYEIAYCMNLNTAEGVNYDNKTGKLVITITDDYIKAGREYVLFGINKQGKTKLFKDLDTNLDTITADIDLDGYVLCVSYVK